MTDKQTERLKELRFKSELTAKEVRELNKLSLIERDENLKIGVLEK
jgi:hypothetical protein